jgi:DnaJ-class molecular chaperone
VKQTEQESRNYAIAVAAAEKRAVYQNEFMATEECARTTVCPKCEGCGLILGKPCSECSTRGVVKRKVVK